MRMKQEEKSEEEEETKNYETRRLQKSLEKK